MDAMLSTVVNCVDHAARITGNVIPWSSPIPSFGDLSTAKVATLGLNPSNLEFVDKKGNELDGPLRRFHTLGSLGLTRWTDANAQHLLLIVEACRAYFRRNPYDGWFRRLDYVISGTGASYYSAPTRACHLDLIPYATACKWNDLVPSQRSELLAAVGNTLAILLRNSPIRLLILNGKSVIEHFEAIAGLNLRKRVMQEWTLRRTSNPGVIGFSYEGTLSTLSGIQLDREVLVLGFNHNIQSSYGVRTEVSTAIRQWVSSRAKKVLA